MWTFHFTLIKQKLQGTKVVLIVVQNFFQYVTYPQDKFSICFTCPCLRMAVSDDRESRHMDPWFPENYVFSLWLATFIIMYTLDSDHKQKLWVEAGWAKIQQMYENLEHDLQLKLSFKYMVTGAYYEWWSIVSLNSNLFASTKAFSAMKCPITSFSINNRKVCGPTTWQLSSKNPGAPLTYFTDRDVWGIFLGMKYWPKGIFWGLWKMRGFFRYCTFHQLKSTITYQ